MTQSLIIRHFYLLFTLDFMPSLVLLIDFPAFALTFQPIKWSINKQFLLLNYYNFSHK